MPKISNSTKWYVVYKLLSKGLLEYYNNNQKKNPGEELYKLFINKEEFVTLNPWIEKAAKNYGVKSVDPIHIFASISASGHSDDTRTKKIKTILDILKVNYTINKIDFYGCPAPFIIKILSSRFLNVQKQIWDLFQRIFQQGRNGLLETDFKNYREWYGIEFSAFTIFLFWIRSDSFLPFDKNTRTFLEGTHVIDKFPNNYNDYISVLNRFDEYNYDKNEKYGSKGLFREITSISYNVIDKRIENNDLTKSFSALLKLRKDSKVIDKIDSSNKENIIEPISNLIASTGLGFKIVAIKPIKNCDKEYLNILKIDEIYYFEKAFEIKKDIVTYNPNKNISIYDLKLITKDTLKVNVTAIVGKNGCGKSSLIEIIYRLINNLSYINKESLGTVDLKFEENLFLEFYYIISGKLFCVIAKEKNIKIQEYIFNGSFFEKYKMPRNFIKSDFNNWFYTIGVNYSHYALNSNIIGEWIDNLFQKNDSYQTPLVINPMRIEGNIDINKENELVISRLMANLFSPILNDSDPGLREITEKQYAIEILFKINLDKNSRLYSRLNQKGKRIDIKYEQLKTPTNEIFKLLDIHFNLKNGERFSKYRAEEECKKYIIQKLVRIPLTYPQYEKYFDSKKIEFIKSRFNEYIYLMKKDNSHVTYKLKQAINYINNPTLISRSENFKLNINEFSNKLESFLSTQPNKEIIEFLPPPIFKADIVLIDKNGVKTKFDKLSSGEKQIIHSVSTILYHIKYIDSVNAEINNLVNYRNVNLLLDEIELYYHPEMQRKYLAFLLNMISKLTLSNISAINICLVTHSPYILSDLPEFYVLKLKDGKSSNDEVKSFGANIHELLTHSFFMESTIGEFAKNKINEIIDFHNKVKNANLNSIIKLKKLYEVKKEEFKFIIENIGEDFIRGILENHIAFIKENLDNIEG